MSIGSRFGSGTQTTRLLLAAALATALLLPLVSAVRRDAPVLLARRSAGLRLTTPMLTRTSRRAVTCSYIYGGYIRNENASVFVAGAFRLTLDFGDAAGRFERRALVTGRNLLPLQEYAYLGILHGQPCSLHLLGSSLEASRWKKLFGPVQPLILVSSASVVDNGGFREGYWRVSATTNGLDVLRSVTGTVLVVRRGDRLRAGGVTGLGSIGVDQTSCGIARLSGSPSEGDSVVVSLHASESEA